MNFDFNLILVPACLILGAIWLIDKLWLKKHSIFKAQLKIVKDSDALVVEKQQKLDELLTQHPLTMQDLENTDTKPADHEQTDTIKDIPDEVSEAYEALKKSQTKLALAKVDLEQNKEPAPVNWAYELFPIIAFFMIIRSFVIEPFNIPSSSMVPTLYTGDFIAVNKSAYGLKLPLIHTKVLDTGSPKHGDVAVFRFPNDPKIYYIKRIIGLPGDTVSYDNGVISVNHQPIDTVAINYTADTDLVNELYPKGMPVGNNRVLSESEAKTLGQEEESVAYYLQESQGEHTHLVRELGNIESAVFAEFLHKNSPEVITSAGKKWQVTVPQGNYFVMGDNRDRSKDGRFWGFVPEENLAGKAVYVWMHKKPGLHLPSFSRNGSID